MINLFKHMISLSLAKEQCMDKEGHVFLTNIIFSKPSTCTKFTMESVCKLYQKIHQ